MVPQQAMKAQTTSSRPLLPLRPFKFILRFKKTSLSERVLYGLLALFIPRLHSLGLVLKSDRRIHYPSYPPVNDNIQPRYAAIQYVSFDEIVGSRLLHSQMEHQRCIREHPRCALSALAPRHSVATTKLFSHLDPGQPCTL